MITSTPPTLIQQKKMQWAREREEMLGLCGIWGDGETPSRLTMSDSRRSSLLPPRQRKCDETRAEESETSGYTSDSPLHDSSSSNSSHSHTKADKEVHNEWRAADDRLRWGDRGVGVGHLWEPVPELPDARLPQLLESYRTTPRWVERQLTHKPDILVIHHGDDPSPTHVHNNYLLGQNVPLPPEVLEERERKRKKALEHQNAIRKQLEERDRKRKEDREAKLREERLEEERVMREQHYERKKREEEMEQEKRRRIKEESYQQEMREALKKAEERANKERGRQKKRELERVNKDYVSIGEEHPIHSLRQQPIHGGKQQLPYVEQKQPIYVEQQPKKQQNVREGWSQTTGGGVGGTETQDACVQCECEGPGDLALVVEGGTSLPLALLVPHPHQLRLVTDAGTQTSRNRSTSPDSVRTDTEPISPERRRGHNHTQCMSSAREDTGFSSKSQMRHSIRERPKWGINRPTVQYLKQSEKDPHYVRRQKQRRRSRSNRRTVDGYAEKTSMPLPSQCRLLPAHTDDETETTAAQESSKLFGTFTPVQPMASPTGLALPENSSPVLTQKQNKISKVEDMLQFGFRMDSGRSSPRFIPLNPSLDRSGIELKSVELDGAEELPSLDRSLSPTNTAAAVAQILSVDSTDNVTNNPGNCNQNQSSPSEHDYTSAGNDADDDDDESVVIQSDLITKISALKLGLTRLREQESATNTASASACSTPTLPHLLSPTI